MLKLASSYRLNSYVSLSLLNARFCYLTGSGSLWNVAIDEVKCVWFLIASKVQIQHRF
jgi:CRISPR/Cas system-associated endonuclease Cas1